MMGQFSMHTNILTIPTNTTAHEMEKRVLTAKAIAKHRKEGLSM
jgi:hypothetical protein